MGILTCFLVLSQQLVPARPGGPRNLILVTIDTLRADRLGAYGYREGRTPTLDWWAAAGTVFERAMSPSPLTLPSHATLLTGLSPLQHGIRDNIGFSLAPHHLTLPEILSREGYATAAFIGSFVLDSRFGLDQGFDLYDADFPLTGMETIAPGYIRRRASEVTDRALAWIGKNSSRDRPFFSWLHFYDPHAPYDPPSPFDGPYRDRPYDGEIAYVDSILARLPAFLEQTGLAASTILVLTSDHGESLGEHGEKTHGLFIYQATQRVPLIWVVPDPSWKAKRVDGTVGLVDVAPTLLEILGIPVPAAMQGRSLLARVARGGEGDRETYAESYYPRLRFGWSPLRSLYRHPFKFIQAPRPELYNLEDDPGELHNLADSHPRLARSLRTRLEQRVGSEAAQKGSSTGVDPDVARALSALGYLSLGSPPPEGDDLRADPKDRTEIYGRINDLYALIAAGDLGAAATGLESMLAAHPSARFAYHPLGFVRARLDQHQQAVEAYEKAARSFPDDSLLHFNLGTSYLRLGRWDQAARAFGEVLRVDPSHFRARSNQASLWLQDGRFEQALQASRQILQRHPRYEPALFNAGVALLALGDPDGAIQHLERVVEANPGNRKAHRYLSQARAARGEKGASEDYLEGMRSFEP